MIRDLYPESRIVYLDRDPMACVTSMMNRWTQWWKGKYADCPASAERNIKRQQALLRDHPTTTTVHFDELVKDDFPRIFEDRTGVRIQDSAFEKHRALRIRN